MALSTAQARREYSAYRCARSKLTVITFLGRSPVRVVPETVEAWLAAEAALQATGYGPAKIVGSYNCRRIAGRTTYSLHAYGLALDIDPSDNWKQKGRQIDWKRTKLTAEQVAAVEAIRTRNGATVFVAGARFPTNVDPMHFQIGARRSDLANGIDAATIRGARQPLRAVTAEVFDTDKAPPLLRLNARGLDVGRLQAALNTAGYGPLDPDGIYGPATGAAVRRFQKANRLKVDGITGPATWEALDAAEVAVQRPQPAAPVSWPTIRRNAADAAAVAELQTRLTVKGADLDVDGRFGPKTEDALRHFQTSAGLDADGIAGPKTWAELHR